MLARLGSAAPVRDVSPWSEETTGAALLAVTSAVAGALLAALVLCLLCGSASSGRPGGGRGVGGAAIRGKAVPSPRAEDESLVAINGGGSSAANGGGGAATLALQSGGMVSVAPPSASLAPLEQHEAGGQRTMAGPTARGGWQCLTYVPAAQIVRVDVSAARGGPSRRLQLTGVSEARWDALTRCATLSAWQAAAQRLVDEAVSDSRSHELV